MIFSKNTHVIITKIMNMFQLREYGETGILGEPALVHVIALHPKIGQEASQVAQNHVQAVPLKRQLVAQVK